MQTILLTKDSEWTVTRKCIAKLRSSNSGNQSGQIICRHGQINDVGSQGSRGQNSINAMNDAIVSDDISSEDVRCIIHACRVEVDRDVFTIESCSSQTISKIS